MRVGEFELVDPVPEMNNTVAIGMLRPWVDVGRVGTLSLRKLEQYLGAKELVGWQNLENFLISPDIDQECVSQTENEFLLNQIPSCIMLKISIQAGITFSFT